MADGSVTINTDLDNKGFEKGLKGLKGIASGVLGSVAGATVAVGSALATITTQSVKARGEIEQSIGGVQTLFKENADAVIENANRAYKTAGVSADEYMKGVTSFSASLLQGLGGDTAKAAKIADMAFIDMSDNANKFGTDMASIQTAYQGFAKQNYTMLDNLKLGYGGTKKEMERLLKDAQKLTGVKYDINNLADVYSAIHAVQEELKITNTTQEEATKTLTGSFTMLKASWDNFLSGSGDIGKVVESAGVAFKNVIRIVNDALPSIMENFYDWLPEIIDLGKEIVGTIVNSVIDNLPMLVSMGAQIVLEIVNGILQNIPLIGENADEITNGIAQVFTGLIDIITTVVTKLSEMYDWLTKHQDILTIIIGIIGTLTAAIVAYTVVQNASAIALAVLNGLLGVYNVVTTIATTVSGAFGAIMAFITSPITLVILAIGALVVAIVLLIKHWDEVKEVALKVWEMIKTAVSNAIELVKKKFEEMKAKIIETFNKVILAVTAWISNMKAKAVEGVKNICDRIMSTFRELPNKVKEVGSNIVHGLWNGIMGLKDWVVEKVKGMGSEIINSLKNVLGIHSPSTKFAEIGKNSILGFEKGFIENSRQVFNELASTVESEASKMNNKLGLNSVIERNINLSNTLQTIESDRNINVNANTYLDGRKIATSVDKVNVRDKLAYGIGG